MSEKITDFGETLPNSRKGQPQKPKRKRSKRTNMHGARVFYCNGKQDDRRLIGKQHGDGVVYFAGTPNRQAAFELMKTHANEIAEWAAQFTEPKTRNDVNRPRVGPVRFDPEIEMTPEVFSEHFHFRGIEFGNWTSQKERRDSLSNAAYALDDLELITEIPAHIDRLGMAFGARGRGNAAAHYERDTHVINLTRKHGPGSLAHEWWHALDFGIGGQPFRDVENALRRETDIVNRAMRMSRYTRRTSSYWTRDCEISARGFECFIRSELAGEGIRNDYLVNYRSIEEWTEWASYLNAGNYAYLLPDEVETMRPYYLEALRCASWECDTSTGKGTLREHTPGTGTFAAPRVSVSTAKIHTPQPPRKKRYEPTC